MALRPPNKLASITTATFLNLWLRELEEAPVVPYLKARNFLLRLSYIEQSDDVKPKVSNYNVQAVKLAITMGKATLLQSGMSYFLVRTGFDDVAGFLKRSDYVNEVSAEANMFMKMAEMVANARMRKRDWDALIWVLSMPVGRADVAMMDVPSNMKGRMMQSIGELANNGLIKMNGSVAHPVIPAGKKVKVIDPQCTDRPPPALYEYAEEKCLNLG